MKIFIGWIVFILLEQKKKLELHKMPSENKDFCNVNMPYEDTKITEFNQYQKSDIAPFIIHTDQMKMLKSAIFVKKNLKINTWKIINILKLEIIVVIRENIEVLHIAYVI